MHHPGFLPFRLHISAAALCGLVLAGAMPAARAQDAPIAYAAMDDSCPVLDEPHRAWAGIRAGAVLSAEAVPGTEDIGTAEAGVWARLFYVENDLGADFEGRIHADAIWLYGFDGDDSTYGLTSAHVALQYSQRFMGGFGLRLDTEPGLHAGGSAFGGAWTAPTGVTLVFAFNSHVALYGGVTARIGFDRILDPRLGLRVTTGDRFQFDLAYPESVLRLRVTQGFRIVAGARYWNRMEYDMGDDDPRLRIGLTEARAYAGFDIGVSESSELILRAGYAFARTLWFEEASPEIDLDDAPFFQIGWQGRF